MNKLHYWKKELRRLHGKLNYNYTAHGVCFVNVTGKVEGVEFDVYIDDSGYISRVWRGEDYSLYTDNKLTILLD